MNQVNIQQLKDFFDSAKGFNIYDRDKAKFITDLTRDNFRLDEGEKSLTVNAPNSETIVFKIRNYMLSLNFLTITDGKNIYQIKRY